jgi:hypothetical protein
VRATRQGIKFIITILIKTERIKLLPIGHDTLVRNVKRYLHYLRVFYSSSCGYRHRFVYVARIKLVFATEIYRGFFYTFTFGPNGSKQFAVL